MFVVSVLVDKELLDGARQGPRRGAGAQGFLPENYFQPEKTPNTNANPLERI